MSDENTNGAENQACQLGIYLEEKTSSIGTGSTAKTAEYRSFWATLCQEGSCAVMVLLNDDFRPTGIREKIPLEKLRGPGWHYIAEGEKRYGLLRPHLDKMMPPPAPAAAPAEKAVASGNWWEGGGGAKPGAPKKKEAPKKKNNWWDS